MRTSTRCGPPSRRCRPGGPWRSRRARAKPHCPMWNHSGRTCGRGACASSPPERDVTVAIRASGLTKRYHKVDALRGIDLSVPSGSVLGLLGPNGAGKTTVVRILATLLEPTGGVAEVAGFDVVRQPREVRRRIGLAGQHTAVDEVLAGRENLVMFAQLLQLGRRSAVRRAGEALGGLRAAPAPPPRPPPPPRGPRAPPVPAPPP